jgi:alpha-tubulin suppressor-like RCC1 family protein
MCWGENSSGRLGNNSTTNSSVPVQVSNLASGVTAIAAGGSSSHSCAVVSGGAAMCWGRNVWGQLGDNSTNSSSVPVQVSNLASGVTAIATGNVHSCAIVNGAAMCWGRNDEGRLGDGSNNNSLVPVSVLNLT